MGKGYKRRGLELLDRVRGNNEKKLKGLKKKFFPTEYLNDEIEILDEKLEQYMQLQRHYCDYYQLKRTQRKDLINDTILSHIKENFETNSACRIVSHQFSQDPLCTIGSVLRPPGGRFNFGKTLDGFENFHCLYLGDCFQTALLEKYHKDVEYEGESITKDFLSLNVSESHSSFVIDCSLERYLDLRDDNFFKDFLECIKDIEDPDQLNKVAKYHNWNQKSSISNAKQLENSIFDPKYNYYGITYGIPSNSQWLGYLCYQLGVQGIVYPSVRSREGFNVAIFIDNFEKSKLSYVKLKDEVKYVTASRRSVNESNFSIFKKTEEL